MSAWRFRVRRGDAFVLSCCVVGISALAMPSPARAPTFRNTAPGVSYTGSKECAPCHRQIYETYIQSPMGRSMSLATDASHLEKIREPFTTLSPLLNRAYTVFRSGSALYQSEQESHTPAASFAASEYKLEYAIGSGLHGHTYLVNRGGGLFQAPLSFYASSQRWDFSPGYEFAESGFTRPITRACLTCHTNAKLLLGSKGTEAVPSLAAANQELAVGCENCHGPGQLHVSERRQRMRVSTAIDTSIVNPAKVPARLSEDICMNCHQGKDARVLQPGRDFSDFRPGKPLSEVLAVFVIPPTPNGSPRSDLLDHHFALRSSKCSLASKARLTCLSCHHPHQQLPADARANSYRGKCLTCHQETSCALSVSQRSSSGTDDCAGCHMPKRDQREVAHTALTNHRIGARDGERFPDEAFQMRPELPGLIYLNGPTNPEAKPLANEVLLQTYAELAGQRPEYLQRYLLLRKQQQRR